MTNDSEIIIDSQVDIISYLRDREMFRFAEDIDKGMMVAMEIYWRKSSPLHKWPGWTKETARNLAKSITFYGRRKR